MTAKEKLFCEYYAITQDKRQAIKEAGYINKSYQSSIAKANRLLVRQDIKDYIAEYLKEQGIKKDLLLARLQQIAFGSVEPLLNQHNQIDLEKAKENGVLHLIKSVVEQNNGTLKVELYDSLSAIKTLLEYSQDDADVTEISVVHMEAVKTRHG